jgi:hypothetical protein
MDRSHADLLSLVASDDDAGRLANSTEMSSEELLVLAQFFACRAHLACERVRHVLQVADSSAEAITHF